MLPGKVFFLSKEARQFIFSGNDNNMQKYGVC